MQLKREMLIKLAKKETDLFPNNKDKQETIFNRYKKFVIPLHEAEWIGLKPWEAMVKQKTIEQENISRMTRPLKEFYAEKIITRLNSGEEIKLKEPDLSK